MPLSWFNDRRKDLRAEPFPSAWEQWLTDNVRHYSYLDTTARATMRAVVRVLVAEKQWTGGCDFDVTDEMKVTVAGQAAVLVVGLDEPYYFDRLQSIILQPDVYRRHRRLEQYLSDRRRLLGEAWYHSPIVISWKHALQAGRDQSNGENVVLHEFAHYLDGLDGAVEGTPPLVDRETERAWHRVVEAEYRKLVGSARRKEFTLLRHYGASNRAEFFAVATECFFEQPHAMCRQHEELYALLSNFYRQSPIDWLPDATVTVADDRQRRAEEDRQADVDMLQSDDVDAIFTFAVFCLNDGKYDLAERAASRAIQLAPDDAEAYQYRAAARVKLGQCQAALQDCNRAIELDDPDEDVYRVRGAAYLGLQQYELALADLSRVFRRGKDDAEAYRLRGSASFGLNQVERALSDYSMSIAINPLLAETYFDRALAYRKLGRSEEANADLEKARQLDPEIGRR